MKTVIAFAICVAAYVTLVISSAVLGSAGLGIASIPPLLGSVVSFCAIKIEDNPATYSPQSEGEA